jgi:hypothetical protein
MNPKQIRERDTLSDRASHGARHRDLGSEADGLESEERRQPRGSRGDDSEELHDSHATHEQYESQHAEDSGRYVDQGATPPERGTGRRRSTGPWSRR